MKLKGKGLWAYRIWELDRAFTIAPQMGITHILYKVGQGPLGSNAPYYIGNAAEVAQKIRTAGLTPLAWSFTTLGDPAFEAQMVSDAFKDGYDGFIFNAEDASSERRQEAKTIGNLLRSAGVDLTKLYLCSYPTPLTHHPDIPYNEMGPYCQGGLMPMAYGTYMLPAEKVIDQWTYAQNLQWMQQQGLKLPICPILGPYFDEQAQQHMNKAEFEVWLGRLAPFAPSFFSLFTAAAMEPDYFPLVRAFVLGDIEPTPTKDAWINNRGGAVFYGSPGKDGTQQAALPYGAQLQTTGSATIVDGKKWIAAQAGNIRGWVRIVDIGDTQPAPWPALTPPPTPPAGQLLTVWTTIQLNIRSQPLVRPDTLIGCTLEGARLRLLQDNVQASAWVGQMGKWFRVKIEPDGPEGWTAAWYTTATDPAPPIRVVEPTLELVVESPDFGFLNIREGASTSFTIVARADHGSVLLALEPEAEVRAKVGQSGKWLYILLPDGNKGYAAASYVRLNAIAPPAETRYVVVNSPDTALALRNGPGLSHPILWRVAHGNVLESLEPADITAAKLGKDGEWLKVRAPAKFEGYVAAWLLKAPDAPDNRRPILDTSLPLGASAWIFGMHAASIGSMDDHNTQRIRSLFESKGKRGWVFFTESIGSQPQVPFDQNKRDRLWAWANAGYGIVVRLNHGYYPSGTLPQSQTYDQFAATCAEWVNLHLKHDEVDPARYTWIIQIGNEQNNPSEHPGDHGVIKEHITPQLYAAAFNKAYARIKAVLPQALVAPGAVDPYNSTPLPLLGNRRYRPLDYFREMLENIPALDAFILHAYTHGPSIEAITWQRTFGDPFLGDHYFDFQTYRQFMEYIPAKWKQLPVLITETNHICRPPNDPACDNEAFQGWINANIGWVRALYQEIAAWNAQPYAQQVRGLFLYRWIEDRWELHNKEQILNDFKEAMDNDYRWRA